MATLYPLNVKVTVFTSSGTWTKDARTKQLLVETLGAGGGSRVSGSGGNGGGSSFGAFVASSGGQGAVAAGVQGAAPSISANRFSFPGGIGDDAVYFPTVVTSSDVGIGGACFFGPPRYRPGASALCGDTGHTAANETNRGCGASTSSNNSGLPRGGGGGAYSVEILNAENVTDTVTVTVGAGGAAGTSGFIGGAGLVIVTEFF